MTTHANPFQRGSIERLIGIGPDDVILGVVPDVPRHRGLPGTVHALLTGAPLILTYRRRTGHGGGHCYAHGATFTVDPSPCSSRHERLPMPAAARRWRHRTRSTRVAHRSHRRRFAAFEEGSASTIHNIYGLTETTSPAIAVPGQPGTRTMRRRAPARSAFLSSTPWSGHRRRRRGTPRRRAR